MAVWRFGDCTFDDGRAELSRAGDVVALEPRAMAILQALITQPGRVISKNELLDEVWGDRFVSESALTTQIKELRRAVGDSGRAQQVIKTVHGRGYMFVADLGRDDPPGDDVSSPMPSDDRAPANPVIAVLPFVDLSPGSGREHVAEGLAHDITNALARHRWLRVLTRAATSEFAARPDAVVGLRQELGAGYVVEGTVRHDDRRMRVTATLTDADTGTCRWTERFDREFDDVFDVLDEIVEVTVSILEPQVGMAERERVIARGVDDLPSWDRFHLGLAHFYRFTAEDNLEAQRLLQECRSMSPEFAEAHAWWAYAVVLGMSYWSTDPDPELLDAALAATNEAVASDNHNAVFHMLRGRVQLARREYENALQENSQAIALNPTFAAAYCGLGDSLCYEGRYDEAIEQFERSVALGTHDPQRWAFYTYGALALLFAGRYEEVLEWTDEALAIPNCQYWTAAHAVVALRHLDRPHDLAAAVDRLLRVCPHFTVRYAESKLFYLKRPEQLALYLEGLRDAGIAEG